MTRLTRAMHVALLLLSGWLVASPWALGFAAAGAATTVTVTIGVMLAATVTMTWLRPHDRRPRRAEFVLAVLLYVSPWAFGYARASDAAANAWMFSTVIGYVAIVQAVELRRARDVAIETAPNPREFIDDVPAGDMHVAGNRTATSVGGVERIPQPRSADLRTREPGARAPVAR